MEKHNAFEVLKTVAIELRSSTDEERKRIFQAYADNCLSLAEAYNRNEPVTSISDLWEKAEKLMAYSISFPLFMSMIYGIDFLELLKDALENGKFVYRVEA